MLVSKQAREKEREREREREIEKERERRMMAAKNSSNYSNNNGSRGSLRSIYARVDLTLSSHIFFRVRYAIPL